MVTYAIVAVSSDVHSSQKGTAFFSKFFLPDVFPNCDFWILSVGQMPDICYSIAYHSSDDKPRVTDPQAIEGNRSFFLSKQNSPQTWSPWSRATLFTHSFGDHPFDPQQYLCESATRIEKERIIFELIERDMMSRCSDGWPNQGHETTSDKVDILSSLVWLVVFQVYWRYVQLGVMMST